MQRVPPGEVVLIRTDEAQRATLRRFVAVIAIQAVVSIVMLTCGTVLIVIGNVGGVAFVVVAALYTVLTALYVQQHNLHAAMRNLRLIAHCNGITYVSEAGTFTAPWSAVKTTKLLRGGRYLRVRVRNWGGPVSKVGLFGDLVIAIAPGMFPGYFPQAVYYFSNGTVTVTE